MKWIKKLFKKKEYWKDLGFKTEIGCLMFYGRYNKTE